MKRFHFFACAGWLLSSLLVGCATADVAGLLFFSGGDPAGGDRLLVGSLETVAKSTQDSLTRLGFQVVAAPEGEALALTASKKGQAHFKLVLTREMTPQGERTRVRVTYFQKSGDSKMAVQVLGDVEKKVK